MAILQLILIIITGFLAIWLKKMLDKLNK